MNQEGWGLKEVMVFIVIVFLCIFISMTVYHKTFGDLFGTGSYDETYSDIERQLENVAKTYTDNYYGKVLENGDEGIVTIRDMQGRGLLTAVKDVKNKQEEVELEKIKGDFKCLFFTSTIIFLISSMKKDFSLFTYFLPFKKSLSISAAKCQCGVLSQGYSTISI